MLNCNETWTGLQERKPKPLCKTKIDPRADPTFRSKIRTFRSSLSVHRKTSIIAWVDALNRTSSCPHIVFYIAWWVWSSGRCIGMGKQYVTTDPETQEEKVGSEFLGHLGLIAGMCDELGLVQFIDEELDPCNAHNNKVSHGECVKTMVMSGLDFASFAFYMYSDYLEDKLLQVILLDRTLDALFDTGVGDLSEKFALKVLKILNIKPKSLHLVHLGYHQLSC